MVLEPNQSDPGSSLDYGSYSGTSSAREEPCIDAVEHMLGVTAELTSPSTRSLLSVGTGM